MKAKERIAVYTKILPLLTKANQTEIDLYLWKHTEGIRLREIMEHFPELRMVVPANVVPMRDFWPCDKAGNVLRRHAMKKMIMFAKQSLHEKVAA